MKKLSNAKGLMWFVFLTFNATIVYMVVKIIVSPTVANPWDIPARVKSDYVLMLVQCMLGVAAMILPGYIRRKVRLDIPNAMMIFYAVFVYCGIYLGEIRGFYYRVPHWDTILHTFSGFALCALGFSIVSLLNKTESVPLSLSPAFVAVFAFCFAMALGSIWEIYEFSIDFFLHTNAQKYALESGELLVGQLALTDTMKDIIVDCLGASAFSVFGYLSVRRSDALFYKLSLKKISD